MGELLDIKNSERFNCAPEGFLKTAQSIGDSLLAFGKLVGDLGEKLDKSSVAYMTKEERDEFVKLESDKMSVVGRVKKFIVTEKLRFELMRKEAKVGSQMRDLVRNVTPKDHCKTIQDMQKEITDLQTRYDEFKRRLEENIRNDGRRAKDVAKRFTGLFAGITGVIGGLVAITFIILHFVPGVNVTLCPVGWTLVAGLGVSAAVGGSITFMCLQKSEIERAMQYMQHLQTNLEDLKDSMMRLESENEVIAETKELEHFQELNEALMRRCDKIVRICDKISETAFRA